MKALLPILLLTLVLAATTPGDGIEGCTGHESQFALGEEKPELVATVANGKKYTIGMCITTQITTGGSSTSFQSRGQPMRWDWPTAPS